MPVILTAKEEPRRLATRGRGTRPRRAATAAGRFVKDRREPRPEDTPNLPCDRLGNGWLTSNGPYPPLTGQLDTKLKFSRSPPIFKSHQDEGWYLHQPTAAARWF